MPNRPIHLPRVTLAVHLVMTGYGHWLPNDPRGSGSTEIRKDELNDLGEIHFGRKKHQPSRHELRHFHDQANPLLDYPILWFDESARVAMGKSFGDVIHDRRYICWPCAILPDHAHLLIRTHKDQADTMWRHFAEASGSSLRAIAALPDKHPIWSSRPYGVLLFSRVEVVKRVPYIEGNPAKHRLPPQHWDFVTRCPWI